MDDKREPTTESASATSSSQDADADAADMAKLGKKQQLKRQFNFWSILGFACVSMVTWEGLLTTFVYGLANGGPAGLVYGFIFVWLGYALCVASLGEMMSMWPTSGGQYHWTYTLSPSGWAPFLSYLCGWQSVIAWQAAVASGTYLTATILQGLVVLNYPDTYHFHRWHGTLIMYAIMAAAVLMGIFGNKILPKLDYVALVLHIIGFIIIVVAVTTLSPTKATASDVFDVWLNNGYSSQGLSFLVGVQGIVFAWLGADAPVHMAEEIKGAARVVPWSMMASIFINGCLGFGVILVVLYYGPTGPDLEAALSSPTGYPFEAIFTYAAGSVAGGTGLSAMILMMTLLATLMIYTAASRELWAFARDNGVPGSRFLACIEKRSKLPLYSLAFTATVTALLDLINIGSAVAFNALISLTVAGYIFSYAFPICLVLWRRIQAARGTGPPLPWGPWRLGIWGIAVNALSLAWIAIVFVFSFFPIEPLPKLTIQSMNWSSLAYGVTMIFAVGFWFVYGKRTFKGPVRDASDGAIDTVLDWGVEQQK